MSGKTIWGQENYLSKCEGKSRPVFLEGRVPVGH